MNTFTNNLINIKDVPGEISNNPMVYTDFFEIDSNNNNTNNDHINNDHTNMYQLQGIKNKNKTKIICIGKSTNDNRISLDHFEYSKKIDIKVLSYVYTKRSLLDDDIFPLILIHVSQIKHTMGKMGKPGKKKLKNICAIGFFFKFNSKITEINDKTEYDGTYSLQFLKDDKLKEIEILKAYPGVNNIEKLISYLVTSDFFQDKILKPLNLK